ncbi:porin family protein [Mongoliitalea daihaiensis]|uniref:porin family protein n=1 Tax=Mongoliitalea daihaiensis TaxID=2782006 RepID=UPI001F35B9D2|nr:porin family protein [Mongoliitalea daihaiensis]UJP65248.1 PorT family protein [Mongoliitalea daihaiensis]
MKRLGFTIVAMFVSFGLYAQDFSIGPKVGVSQSNISVSGDGFESGEATLGYHVGAFIRMGGSSIYVQPEFLYTNTGGTIIQKNANSVDATIDANFNRLDIPFMVGFKLAKVFRIQAGPIASILLDYTLNDALNVAQDVDYKSSTLGYQAGIGFDLGNLILDLKYENSLGKISQSIAGFNTDQRQNQLMVSAGFRLF